jgi:hypothetical protein
MQIESIKLRGETTEEVVEQTAAAAIPSKIKIKKISHPLF